MDEKAEEGSGDLSKEEPMERDIKALRAWLRANSEFEFSDEQISDFVEGKADTMRINEDYSNYDSQRCNNGGAYGFWTNLNREDSGLYYISLHTTADFEYCEACGSFSGHDPEACGFDYIDLRTKEQKIATMRETEQRLLDELSRLREDIEGMEAIQ